MDTLSKRPRNRPRPRDMALPATMTPMAMAFGLAWERFSRPMAPTTMGRRNSFFGAGTASPRRRRARRKTTTAMAMAIEVRVISDRQLVRGLVAHLVPADGQSKAAGDGHGHRHEDQGVGKGIEADPVGAHPVGELRGVPVIGAVGEEEPGSDE